MPAVSPRQAPHQAPAGTPTSWWRGRPSVAHVVIPEVAPWPSPPRPFTGQRLCLTRVTTAPQTDTCGFGGGTQGWRRWLGSPQLMLTLWLLPLAAPQDDEKPQGPPRCGRSASDWQLVLPSVQATDFQRGSAGPPRGPRRGLEGILAVAAGREGGGTQPHGAQDAPRHTATQTHVSGVLTMRHPGP